MGTDRTLTLRQRLVLLAALAALVLTTTAALLFTLLTDRAARRDAEAHVAALADRTAELVVARDDLEALIVIAAHGEQVIVVDTERDVVLSSGDVIADPATLASRLPPEGGCRLGVVDGDELVRGLGGRYSIFCQPVTRPDGERLVVHALTSVTASFGLGTARGVLIAAMYALATLDVVFMGVFARLALRPVDRMREDVERIEGGDLSERIDVPDVSDEIGRLGQTFNHLLERVEENSLRQRRFSAAASHELRSPLSALRTQLEVGLRYPDRVDWVKVASESLVEVDRLENMSRDLRTLTRAATSGPMERFDLSVMLAAELDGRRPPRDLMHVRNLEPAPIVADFEGVTRVVRNLLDNAERHARTHVAVTVAVESTSVLLTVTNDGRSIPLDELERIFEPYMRLDEARAYNDGGSGLGLAIARAIMLAHKGTLVSLPSASGAMFVAQFPAAGAVAAATTAPAERPRPRARVAG